jgi:nucleotide-binding universal stress UspA family protein
MYTHVLVPLDGSELAEVALPHAITMAKPTGATVTLLRILEPSVPGPAMGGQEGLYIEPEFWQKLQQDRLNEARSYLERVAARLTSEGLRAQIEVRRGSAADVIVDTAKELGADLIVMATHGRSGIGRWMLGSVADRVVRASHLPVLLIRPAKLPEE